MKKSRIAKFALLGASTAALAATLTTSTYAWYVSNKTAGMEAGQGATGSAGSDGSILVSWTGNDNTWFKTVSFADQDANIQMNNPLQPIHYDGTDEDFYGIASNGQKGAAASDYVQFTLKIKSLQGAGKQTIVTPTFVFNNFGSASIGGTPTAPATQIAMVGTADGAPVEKGRAFYVNALDSMYVQQNIAGSLSYSPANAQSCSVGSNFSGGATTGSAHTYYEAVTSNQVYADATNWVSGPLSTITVVESTIYTITYTIFLDGADVNCFNTAAGQNFSFALTFTAADPTAYPGA